MCVCVYTCMYICVYIYCTYICDRTDECVCVCVIGRIANKTLYIPMGSLKHQVVDVWHEWDSTQYHGWKKIWQIFLILESKQTMCQGGVAVRSSSPKDFSLWHTHCSTDWEQMLSRASVLALSLGRHLWGGENLMQECRDKFKYVTTQQVPSRTSANLRKPENAVWESNRFD